MKKLFFLLLFITAVGAYAQNAGDDQAPLRLVFKQADFGERFSVQAEQDDAYNYFVTDLTKFSSKLERTLFLNLVFEDDKIISIDSDLSKDQLWFKAPASMAVQDVNCKFDDLRAEAVKKAASMSDTDKSSFVGKNEKFNEKKD